MLLTNLSAEQIVGLNRQAFTEGILVMTWETLAAIAMVLTAIWFLPKYMKGGISTIPEFIEKRFNENTKAILSVLFLIAFSIVLLPTILYSGSLAFSTMFNLPSLLVWSASSAIWLSVWSIHSTGVICATGLFINGVLMYLTSLLILYPHFIDQAMYEAFSNGITDANQLAVIKAEAYPHFLYIMGILFIINVIIMLIIGILKPKTDTYIPATTEVIDTTPWKYTLLTVAFNTILVISTYLIF